MSPLILGIEKHPHRPLSNPVDPVKSNPIKVVMYI